MWEALELHKQVFVKKKAGLESEVAGGHIGFTLAVSIAPVRVHWPVSRSTIFDDSFSAFWIRRIVFTKELAEQTQAYMTKTDCAQQFLLLWMIKSSSKTIGKSRWTKVLIKVGYSKVYQEIAYSQLSRRN